MTTKSRRFSSQTRRKGNPKSNLTVLVVDDDDDFRELIRDNLASTGWKVLAAGSAAKALDLAKKDHPDILVSDVYMPEMDGIELAKQLKDISKDIEVIITTGFSDERLAVKALKVGAFDYLHKPFALGDLQTSLLRTKCYRELNLENKRLCQLMGNFSSPSEGFQWIGESEVAKDLIRKIEQAASSSVLTILLSGESGVGKEIAARRIHHISRDKEKPFIAVNCGAFAHSLLESELFGREVGAFTGADKMVPGVFEMAQGGTILLDEITEMNLEAQTRFLRVLEDRKFRRLGGTQEISIKSTRIIGATNQNLEALVNTGKFRRDLYYRISVASIEIPPLRDRVEDIVPYTYYFLENCSKQTGKNVSLTRAAKRVLLNYSYPGNIRELRNILERSIVFAKGEKIDAFDLGISEMKSTKSSPSSGNSMPYFPDALNLMILEERAVRKALSLYPNDKTRAAAELGISIQALYRKIKKHDLCWKKS